MGALITVYLLALFVACNEFYWMSICMCTFPLQCRHGFLKNTPDVYIGNHMQSILSKRIICKVFSAWLAYVLKLNSSNGVDHQHINGTFCFHCVWILWDFSSSKPTQYALNLSLHGSKPMIHFIIYKHWIFFCLILFVFLLNIFDFV